MFKGVNDQYEKNYKPSVGIKNKSKNITIVDNTIPWAVVFKKQYFMRIVNYHTIMVSMKIYFPLDFYFIYVYIFFVLSFKSIFSL